MHFFLDGRVLLERMGDHALLRALGHVLHQDGIGQVQLRLGDLKILLDLRGLPSRPGDGLRARRRGRSMFFQLITLGFVTDKAPFVR